MAKQLGPIDVRCDAPDYRIVRACEDFGFVTPLDVRWCRVSHLPPSSLEVDRFDAPQPDPTVHNSSQPRVKQCLCGHSLPSLDWYSFITSRGICLTFLLSQCHKCRSIYWEEI
jgi:hypothetical protein